jgi:hypothetical protein
MGVADERLFALEPGRPVAGGNERSRGLEPESLRRRRVL